MKTKKFGHKLTLDRPVTYQIKVPGHLDEMYAEWAQDMTVTLETDSEGLPITTLTGTIDQAALLGLLRRCYTRGLPLISVICVQIS